MSKFIVETSARHVHVTQEHLEVLFGKGAALTHKKDLSQPGQFACEERVKIVGPNSEMAGVSILGPVRPATQVEIAVTDARLFALTVDLMLGIAVIFCYYCDVSGSGACKIVGPCGEVEISEGVIVAKRHIHMTPADAAEFGVSDKEIVNVKIDTADRSLIFGDVVVRVSEKFALAMHIDTDESNAAGCGREVYGEIVK